MIYKLIVNSMMVSLLAVSIGNLSGDIHKAKTASPQEESNMTKCRYVKMDTNLGPFVIELDWEKAPKTSENFVRYVTEGFYDGTIFHRVIPGFVVQGGGYTRTFDKKPTHEPIVNESDNGLSNLRGTIAMARTADPHSATSQFYINLVDNTRLDFQSGKWGYAVFGRVIKGMETVDKIAKIPTGARGPFSKDVPLEDAYIVKASCQSDLKGGD